MIADWQHGAALVAVAAVACVGLMMFLTGSRRALQSAGERDTRLMAWALLRLGLGAALWWVFQHPPADAAFWVFLARALLQPYGEMIVAALALWLAVPAVARLLLLLWGGQRAEGIIRRLLQRRNAPLVPARRRRFFIFR